MFVFTLVASTVEAREYRSSRSRYRSYSTYRSYRTYRSRPRYTYRVRPSRRLVVGDKSIRGTLAGALIGGIIGEVADDKGGEGAAIGALIGFLTGSGMDQRDEHYTVRGRSGHDHRYRRESGRVQYRVCTIPLRDNYFKVRLRYLGNNHWAGPDGAVFRGMPSAETLRTLYGY